VEYYGESALRTFLSFLSISFRNGEGISDARMMLRTASYGSFQYYYNFIIGEVFYYF
jgi:hypothetical protein